MTNVEQLKGLAASNFRIIEFGDTYLAYQTEEGQRSAVRIDGEDVDDGIALWLKKWNIGELMELNFSEAASLIERKLTATETEMLDAAIYKMIRCKELGQAHYENKLFDEL